jgi:threonine dehydratase
MLQLMLKLKRSFNKERVFEMMVVSGKVGLEDIIRANHVLSKVIEPSPLQRNELLSSQYECNVYLKREDMQIVRSFKIRGAYNVIQSLTEEERAAGSCVCECRQPCTGCSLFL